MASISQLAPSDREAAIATVVAAFAEDPVERWLWADLYHRHFPDFASAFAGPAFERGTAWGVDGTDAVALWLAPGSEADEEEVVAVLDRSVPARQHDDMYAVLGQMAEVHPTEPHWYLPWLAAAPSLQGGGRGSDLLAHTLAAVDADGLPAFLETPNPRTVPLYERHGFEVIANPQAGSCPPMTSMLRAAR